MLAKQGYTALALDMYGTGKLAKHPKDAMSFMMAATKSADIMKARFLAAYEILKSTPPSIDLKQQLSVIVLVAMWR